MSSNKSSPSNTNDSERPVFRFYEKLYLNNDIVGLVLGKEKVNLNTLKSISNNVIVSFVGLREKDFSLIILKSNYQDEFKAVLKATRHTINEANNKLNSIKEQKKGLKIVKQKQRENKIKKEIAERIKKEIATKELESLKSQCNNNEEVRNIEITNEVTKAFNQQKTKNGFYGLEVNYDD